MIYCSTYTSKFKSKTITFIFFKMSLVRNNQVPSFDITHPNNDISNMKSIFSNNPWKKCKVKLVDDILWAEKKKGCSTLISNKKSNLFSTGNKKSSIRSVKCWKLPDCYFIFFVDLSSRFLCVLMARRYTWSDRWPEGRLFDLRLRFGVFLTTGGIWRVSSLRLRLFQCAQLFRQTFLGHCVPFLWLPLAFRQHHVRLVLFLKHKNENSDFEESAVYPYCRRLDSIFLFIYIDKSLLRYSHAEVL